MGSSVILFPHLKHFNVEPHFLHLISIAFAVSNVSIALKMSKPIVASFFIVASFRHRPMEVCYG